MRVTFQFASLLCVVVACTCSSASAAIIATADPAYDTTGAAFTLDPEANSPAVFTFNSTRLMRQTFQTDATIDVDSLVFSLETNGVGTDSVVTVNLYEIEDVTSSSWTPGTLVTSFGFTPVESDTQTGITLTGSDKFLLPERSSGVAGYGIEFDLNDDNTTYSGSMGYSNSGTDEYANGVMFGPFSRPNGDYGLSISGSEIPEPASCVLVGVVCCLGLLAYRRR